MTTVTNYKCDICAAVYDTEEECRQCESFHITPTELRGVVFKSIKQSNIPYPAFALFAMEDGSLAKYIYNELIDTYEETQPEPSEPDEPVEPTEPTEPDEHTEPDEPTEPTEPDEPIIDDGQNDEVQEP